MAKPLSECAVGFEKLYSDLSLANLKLAARRAGNLIRDDMSRRARRKSGKLADSIMTSIESGATIDQVVVKIGPNKKLDWRAHFIEFGVRPHVITAKRARVLADKETGDLFGRGAHHPGLRADPFIRPALDENAEAAALLFAEELDKMIIKAFE